jgi:hypothetical protein
MANLAHMNENPMISSVFWAFHVGHHHDHLADMMANMKPSQCDEGG